MFIEASYMLDTVLDLRGNSLVKGSELNWVTRDSDNSLEWAECGRTSGVQIREGRGEECAGEGTGPH